MDRPESSRILARKPFRFGTILEEQSRLAKKYSVISPFLEEEGAMEVTAEEHQVIKEFLELREKAELLIRKRWAGNRRKPDRPATGVTG